MCLFLKCIKCKVKISNDLENNKTNINNEEESITKLEKYSKFEKVAFGATSKVYLTKKNKKTYICKTINRDSLKKGYREINVLKKLKGKYLPVFHEYIAFDNNLFIFLEYENSVDLHKYYFNLNINSVPINETINIIRQMGHAINSLHSLNLIHLDLKLENFIINSKSHIKLIDFGTVHPLVNKETKLKSIIGTKNYIPPEIYRSAYHINSDVWSFGVCVWILLFKKYCFNHNKITRKYTLETLPYSLFKFPNQKHYIILKKYDSKLCELFIDIFKLFPLDRPCIDYIINFNYEKYLIMNK